MASRPTRNSPRLRQCESSVYAWTTRAGSRVFQACSASLTFAMAAVSSKGGRIAGGAGSASTRMLARLDDREVDIDGERTVEQVRQDVDRDVADDVAQFGIGETRRTRGVDVL